MTKEELKQEAEEYANNLLFVYETDIVQRIVRERVKLALIDVLETREKRIEELEAQIKNITGLLNDILWKCTCKEYEKATQALKELVNELEKEND